MPNSPAHTPRAVGGFGPTAVRIAHGIPVSQKPQLSPSAAKYEAMKSARKAGTPRSSPASARGPRPTSASSPYAKQLQQLMRESAPPSAPLSEREPQPAVAADVLPAQSTKPPRLNIGTKGQGPAPTFASARRALSARPQSPGRPTSARPSSARASGDPLAGFGYVTLSPIANGAFSTVCRAKHLATQREVATKTFHKARYLQPGNAHLAQAMRNEIDVLRRLAPQQHPHIANIIEVVETAQAYVAVLEYCGGGSLQRLLQKNGACDRPHSLGLDERLARSISYQLADALGHMHGLGIAHRDVKPENVLFVGVGLETIKLCDFGFAVACGHKRLKTVCGTPQYMAPEIEASGSKEPYAGWAADMWALACCMFELLEGKPAFRGASVTQLNMRLVRASHEAFTAATPQQARALIKRILIMDAEKRLNAHQVMGGMWFAPNRRAAAARAEAAENTPRHPPPTYRDDHSDEERENAPVVMCS